MNTRKIFSLLAMLMYVVTTWAQTSVSTDQELRDAIADKAIIKLTSDIDLSNSTLSIPSGTKVTIDLGGYALDRKLTQRGEGGGQVITIREGATLNLSNGTLKGGWGGKCTVCGTEIVETPTGVEEVQCSMFKVQGSDWYDMFGRKLNFKPTQKGMYIHNGKAVVIE